MVIIHVCCMWYIRNMGLYHIYVQLTYSKKNHFFHDFFIILAFRGQFRQNLGFGSQGQEFNPPFPDVFRGGFTPPVFDLQGRRFFI